MRLAGCLFATVLSVLVLAGSAQAISSYHFVVTTTADTNGTPCDPTPDPTCSLREAIAAANANSGGFVDVPPGTYVVGSPLSVTKGITITGTDGPRATRISGGHSTQVFTIANTTGTPAQLTGLTIADAAGNNQIQGGGVSITNGGPVQISDSAIVDNHIDGVGAGIFLAPAGNLTIERSLIAHNSTPLGGGGLVPAPQPARLRRLASVHPEHDHRLQLSV